MSDIKVNPATLEFIKKQQAQKRQRRAIASIVGLLLVGGISFGGYLGWSKYQKSHQAELAKSLVADLKPGQGREAFEKIRAAVDSGQITRDQMRDAFEKARDAEEQQRLDGYFKTPAKDREKYLDALIDEQQKRMAEWQKNRPTTWPTSRPTTRPFRGGPTTLPTDAERAARAQARADNQSPMQRAQQSEFRAAMRARMQARGMGGPGGPGGGGGRGWGGGPGGGGGRRG